MTVKRYSEGGYGLSDIEINDDGDYVSYEDYAELQRKVESLAVEIVQAKQVIYECKAYFIAGITNQIRPTSEGYLHMLCDTTLDETPATDAALAEILAQGVDRYAEVIIDTLNMDVKHNKEFLKGTLWFADQLRKESVK